MAIQKNLTIERAVEKIASQAKKVQKRMVWARMMLRPFHENHAGDSTYGSRIVLNSDQMEWIKISEASQAFTKAKTMVVPLCKNAYSDKSAPMLAIENKDVLSTGG